jgi:hypothetical protein
MNATNAIVVGNVVHSLSVCLILANKQRYFVSQSGCPESVGNVVHSLSVRDPKRNCSQFVAQGAKSSLESCIVTTAALTRSLVFILRDNTAENVR